MFLFNGSKKFVTGFAIGFGMGLIARDSWPHVKRAFRPAAKETLKLGIRLLERGRETLARAGEGVSDMFAEASFELRQEKIAASAPRKKRRVPRVKKTVPEDEGRVA